MSCWNKSTIKNLLAKFTTSSPAIAKPFVVGSQSPVSAEKTFYNSKEYFPLDMDLFDSYVKRRNEYDKKYKSLVKRRWVSKESYNNWRHYYALGVTG